MQAPGGPWEDPTKGFKFGGWAMPYFDQVGGEEIDRVVGHYEREGKIKIGDTALDSPSDREVARRERMKREG